MSDLRSRLRAIAAEGKKAAAADTPRYGGTVRIETVFPMEEEARHPDETALRRMGFTGDSFDIERCLFLDTETTGLSGGVGTVAFLVGIGYVTENGFTVEQFLIKDYPSEPEMLLMLSERFRGRDIFVTFNGRTFDIPLLESRFTMCRMRERFPAEYSHLDLIYPSRACWKKRIGRCTLSDIERSVLGYRRVDDIPGKDVPALFFRFLEEKDLSILNNVLEHNRQDIYSLLRLIVRIGRVFAHPDRLEYQTDIYSMGNVLLRHGERDEARALYHIAAFPSAHRFAFNRRHITELSLWKLYFEARRDRNYPEMKQYLDRLLRSPNCGARACVEASKMYEHVYRDYATAADYAERASHFPDAAKYDDTAKRLERLNTKMRGIRHDEAANNDKGE